MGRLIDEDAVKRRMHETMDYQDLYLPVHFEMCMNDAPTVEPASPWHRVEEKPDEHTNLWLHDERGNYHVGCVSTYRGYTEYIDMGGNTLHDIDYWMPIEPPKEEK